jgi:hypothetical protein
LGAFGAVVTGDGSGVSLASFSSSSTASTRPICASWPVSWACGEITLGGTAPIARPAEKHSSLTPIEPG